MKDGETIKNFGVDRKQSLMNVHVNGSWKRAVSVEVVAEANDSDAFSVVATCSAVGFPAKQSSVGRHF